jgi:hypothetical protein
MVINLVNITSIQLELNAAATMEKINKGEAPYIDPDNASLNTFVYGYGPVHGGACNKSAAGRFK